MEMWFQMSAHYIDIIMIVFVALQRFILSNTFPNILTIF